MRKTLIIFIGVLFFSNVGNSQAGDDGQLTDYDQDYIQKCFKGASEVLYTEPPCPKGYESQDNKWQEEVNVSSVKNDNAATKNNLPVPTPPINMKPEEASLEASQK